MGVERIGRVAGDAINHAPRVRGPIGRKGQQSSQESQQSGGCGVSATCQDSQASEQSGQGRVRRNSK